MSILEHLKDLRKHVLWSLLGILIGAVGGWFLYDPVMDYITAPLLDIQDANTQINFPTIGAALDLKLRVSLWVGLIISCPWWIFQMGAFIVPGLKRKERWYAFAFGAVGVVLFVSGAATGVALVPRAVEILQSFVPVGGSSLLQADAYVDFYTRLVILFGISFLIPEVLVALNFLGVLSALNMLRAWRWAVLVAFTFAAIANPLPSPWPMIVQALVLVALYLLAVLISWVNERYRKFGWRLRERKKDDGAAVVVPGGSQGPGGYPVPVDAVGPAPMGPGGYPVPAPVLPQVPESGAPSEVGVAAEQFGPVVGPMGGTEAPIVPVQTSASVPVSTPVVQAQPAAATAAQLCGVVILAGGTARRMGGVSKPDVVVGGKTLLLRAIEEVRVVAPEAAIVVVAPPQVAIPQGVARVLEDPPFGGPVAGVAAGFDRLTTLPGYRPGGLVGLLTCDAPLAPRLYPALEQSYREATVQSLREANATDGGQPAQFVGGAVPLVIEENTAGAAEDRHGSAVAQKRRDGYAANTPPASAVSSTPGVGTFGADGATGAGEAAKLSGEKPSTYSQYLHGVYVAGALAQLFAAQVRDRSVRSLFKQLRLATVSDDARIGMDVDTWEDAAELERRLVEFG
ncbi:MAG: twin-arginine translocase subunit TatC [Ancrocorticia sp.]